MAIYLKELSKLWGKSLPEVPITSDELLGAISTDSRTIKKGDCFVALVGSNFDGHQFLKEAYQRGARVAVVSKNGFFAVPDDLICWRVEDTVKAYQQLALLHRKKLDIPVIAVTGSAGKTTTRELIASCLSSLGSIVSSASNNNNDIGVPLTLLQANTKDSGIVVEMGMRGLGQISRLSCCAEPDIAVITNIGNAHIGLLGTLRNIAKAKCEITSYLNPNGFVVIPAGDPLLESVLTENWKGRIIRVDVQLVSSTEIEPPSTYRSSLFKEVDYLGCLDETNKLLRVNGITLSLPLEGKHNALNFMLAIAVALEIGVPIDLLRKVHIDLPQGRSRCLKFDGLTVLDETYNSSPEAVKASLDVLVSKPGRHFAVLGTMLELGDKSISLHSSIALKSVELGLSGLIIISKGPEAEVMASIAKQLPVCYVFSTPEECFPVLSTILKPGDNILLKGSRKIGLERLIPLLETVTF